VLKHRIIMAVVFVGVLVARIISSISFRKDFIPDADTDQISVTLELLRGLVPQDGGILQALADVIRTD